MRWSPLVPGHSWGIDYFSSDSRQSREKVAVPAHSPCSILLSPGFPGAQERQRVCEQHKGVPERLHCVSCRGESSLGDTITDRYPDLCVEKQLTKECRGQEEAQPWTNWAPDTWLSCSEKNKNKTQTSNTSYNLQNENPQNCASCWAF